MIILKNGTPTGFQDRNGQEIKTADRIKHVVDGSICVIDKFARAVSPLGFKYELSSLHCSRGMNVDGTYFAKLTDYELTDEEPPKPKGESVRPGNDGENMAPDRVRDPRNESLKKENWKKVRKAAEMSELQKYIDKLPLEGHAVDVITPEAQGDAIRIKLDGRDITFDEIKAVANGITEDDARKTLALQDYQDEDLADELRARGYHGEIRRTKTIII